MLSAFVALFHTTAKGSPCIKVARRTGWGSTLFLRLDDKAIESMLACFDESIIGREMRAVQATYTATLAPKPVEVVATVKPAKINASMAEQIKAGVDAVIASMGLTPTPEPEPEPEPMTPLDALHAACKAAGCKPADIPGMHAATRGTILQHALELQNIL
jgi:hypothetical protein